MSIFASTTFLADIAQNVTGARAKVVSLLPVGADPHAYQATPADVVKISESTVLILNGLEYEHFIEPLLQSADGERLVVSATEGLEPRQLEERGDETASGSGGHEPGDPHLWLDPVLVITYVENIRDGLSQADPASAEAYKSNAEAYIAQLNDLDAWIQETGDKGQYPESPAMYDSDMKVYLDGMRSRPDQAAIIEANIRPMKTWRDQGI